MVLVVGATGLVGHEVCLRLLAQGERVRALVRNTSDPARVASLRAAGAEICLGDLKVPASLATACSGAEAVLSTATSTLSRQPGDSIQTVDDEGQLALVKAAKEEGISRFLFVSFRLPDGIAVPIAEAKHHVEEAIASLNYTILRPSFFMQTWLSPALGFDYNNAQARIFGAGTNPISWVSSTDVAALCALALHHPEAQKTSVEIGGPQAISPLEVVSLFERLSGKSFNVEHVPLQALMEQFQAASDPLQKSFAALGLGFAQGEIMDMAQTQQTFGLKLTSVEDYARSVLQV